MPVLIASFGCGLIFGIGLLISGMTDPNKVLDFLDLFGAWDATLAFVMAGAVGVASAGFALARRRGAPVLARASLWPSQTDISVALPVGGMLFGVGWGLIGLCPGPAIVNLAGMRLPVLIFVIAMAAGMSVYDLWQRRNVPAELDHAAPAGSDG